MRLVRTRRHQVIGAAVLLAGALASGQRYVAASRLHRQETVFASAVTAVAAVSAVVDDLAARIVQMGAAESGGAREHARAEAAAGQLDARRLAALAATLESAPLRNILNDGRARELSELIATEATAARELSVAASGMFTAYEAAYAAGTVSAVDTTRVVRIRALMKEVADLSRQSALVSAGIKP